MSTLFRNVIAGFLVAGAAFFALAQYSFSTAPKMQWDSKLVLNEFYVRSQAGNYSQAHQLLSRNLKQNIGVQPLGQQWQAFERAHGPIKNWVPARGGTIGGDKMNILPRYVDFTHKVAGKKNSVGVVAVRMIPENGKWRIDRLTIKP